MKIKAKEDYDWSVDYKVRSFKKGEVCELPEVLAMKMVNSGRAEVCTEKPKKVEEVKAIDPVSEKPVAGPAENKAIESADENKEAPKKSKSKKKK